MNTPAGLADRIRLLYGPDADATIATLEAVIADYSVSVGRGGTRRRWGCADAILITYADTISTPGEAPLHTLGEVLQGLTGGLIPTVHLLPFFPWTSDDGFSVADYLAVDPAAGTWADVAALRARVELMFDAVINHTSVSHRWFRRFLDANDAYSDWYITVDPDADTSAVVRPRTLPLVTDFEGAGGVRRVWTTFSADQVDLNYATPAVLVKMVCVLLEYVERGASVIRLDAVTYLWKRLGTTCVNLPETHAVIQLLRLVLDAVAPDVTLVTETNVPHEENVSYFGDGHDEAQLVYNFALPPLVLHSFVAGSAAALAGWASGLLTPSGETEFFNFLASHDGIGLRGVEGMLSAAELATLAERAAARGGFVGYRSTPDGRVPYELNINLFDALSGPDDPDGVARFLTAQSIMLALPGVPGIYLHSLLGSVGDPDAVARTGVPRSINRAKLDRDTLLADLADPSGQRARVLAGYHLLLSVRRSHEAFDPHAPSVVVEADPRLFVLDRGAGEGLVRCVHNVCGEPADIPTDGRRWRDLLTGDDAATTVAPWGIRWLTPLD